MSRSSRRIAPLFEGPVDIIGDVHGEIVALGSLLAHLGYGAEGDHSQGRRPVFVGDLCDRGPDSPAVLDLVIERVRAGLAQCVLGNHELNVLFGSPKHGNGWFFDRNHDHDAGEFLHSAAATAARRAEWLEFLATQPVALEREDLRIVHACWSDAALGSLRRFPASASYDEVNRELMESARSEARASGLETEAARELKSYRHLLRNPDAVLPPLPFLARLGEQFQNSNPLKVLTSGLEHAADAPFWAGGKWRLTDRVRWWKDYRASVPVIVGHYWRRDAGATPQEVTGDWDYLFEDCGAYDWLGPDANVFCVDYSVGGRYLERAHGRSSGFQCRLAALRWPERELVFDDGERLDVAGGPHCSRQPPATGDH